MSRQIPEFALFVAVATALHLLLWLRVPAGELQSAGDGGDAAISLAAINPEIAEMIENFETPPEIPDADGLPDMTPPPTPGPPPPIRAAPARPDALPAPHMPQLSALVGIDLPRVDLPPPLPEPAQQVEAAVETELLKPPPEKAEPEQVPEPEEALFESPRPPQRPAPPPRAQAEAPRNAPPGQQTRSAQSEQRAAGSGGSTSAGAASQSQTSGLSPARRQSLMASWGSQIRSRVERRKSHPRGVRASGTATVRLVVATDGRLVSLSLVRSSGVAEFDQAALDAVRRAGRFRAAPKQLGSGQHSFTLPIQFRG